MVSADDAGDSGIHFGLQLMSVFARVRPTIARQMRRLGRVLDPVFRRLPIAGCIGPLTFVLRQNQHHVFFGYYDHSPFSHDETKVLAHRTDHPLSTPAPTSSIDIGVFDLSDSTDRAFVRVDSTQAWCWQQGSRLQWYPRDCPTSNVIFNSVEKGELGAKIVCVESLKTVRTLPISLYDVSKCGKYGLSLNFSRLQVLRPGYGYTTPKQSAAEPALTNDGIFLFDFSRDRVSLFASLAEIMAKEPLPLGGGRWEHYINHLSFSPDGERFLFLHLMSNGKRRMSRMFVASRVDGTLKLLNGSGRVSHYAWNGNNRILVYCALVATEPMQYFEYDIDAGNVGPKFAEAKGDGHPTYSDDGRIVVTDTYPNRMGYQTLMCFDVIGDRLAGRRLLHRDPKFAGEVRTDLHPRLSRTGRWIVVDDESQGWKAMKIFSVRYGA